MTFQQAAFIVASPPSSSKRTVPRKHVQGKTYDIALADGTNTITKILALYLIRYDLVRRRSNAPPRLDSMYVEPKGTSHAYK
jgi:hypothetical protein